MRIENEVKLDFDDVLIRPKRSTLSSRKEVDVFREFTFRNSKRTFNGIPIISANMDTVGTFDMATALSNFGLMTALHKHYNVKELRKFWEDNEKMSENYIFYSMGVSDADLKKVKEFSNDYKNFLHFLCIDVANGYSEPFVEFVKEMREKLPGTTIMAGNVVTGEMVEELILAGADIVKVGIGPGCLTKNSRILMANGQYKNISDIKTGEMIITKDGTAAKVNKSFSTGFRKIRKVRTNSWYKDLLLTSDHKCWVGDLSSTATDTIVSAGYKQLLEKKTKNSESKLKWKKIEECVEKTVALMPTKIDFQIQENFKIDISNYFERKNQLKNYKTVIESNYYLGYMFGFFLGDGSWVHKTYQSKDRKRLVGRLEWAIYKEDKKYIEKLTKCIKHATGKAPKLRYDNNVVKVTLYSCQWAKILKDFGKREEKCLPWKYMARNKNYINGLYDGLMDSDGTYDNEIPKFGNTSTKLIELFLLLTNLKFNVWPNVRENGINITERVSAKNMSYRTYLMKSVQKRILSSNEQIVKIMDISDEHDEVEVFDLEIDHPSHSFIANNMIVHNSVCTTRKMTGVGYPQLSAVIECADAAHGLGGHVCADGGCTVPGDLAKAFGAGADFVMLGGMFAGHDESGGEVFETNGEKFMKFYGMSSSTAMEKHAGGVAEYRASEGKTVKVPYRGPVVNTVKEILGGLRSACTYVGARKLKELSKRTTFVRVSGKQQLNTSFGND